jgi:hypothetical protein
VLIKGLAERADSRYNKHHDFYRRLKQSRRKNSDFYQNMKQKLAGMINRFQLFHTNVQHNTPGGSMLG